MNRGLTVRRVENGCIFFESHNFRLIKIKMCMQWEWMCNIKCNVIMTENLHFICFLYYFVFLFGSWVFFLAFSHTHTHTRAGQCQASKASQALRHSGIEAMLAQHSTRKKRNKPDQQKMVMSETRFVSISSNENVYVCTIKKKETKNNNNNKKNICPSWAYRYSTFLYTKWSNWGISTEKKSPRVLYCATVLCLQCECTLFIAWSWRKSKKKYK